MRMLIASRLALAGGTLSLLISFSQRTTAQDTPPLPGSPVIDPKTNHEARPPRLPLGAELPPVPETASDPAPPGTKGVRVDVPQGGTPTAPAPGSDASTTMKRPANVLMAEGVVTRLDRAGKNVNGELERFAFDPSQDWYSFTNRGPQGILDKDAERPKGNAAIKEANAKAEEAMPGDNSKLLEMAITKRTYVYTHARSPDGTDLYGAITQSSPDTISSASGLTNRPPSARPDAPVRTNFTNIKEGSFVSVRYRKVGDLNEVLNLTLIEMPLMPADEQPTSVAPRTPTTAPARATPAAAAPGTTPTIPPTTTGVGGLPR